MSTFTEPLNLEPDVHLWRVARGFAFEIGRKGSGLAIQVEAGTLTDLGTIPRLFWAILPPHDPEVAAAFVLHDRLCQDREFDRHTADAIFLEAMKVLGVPFARRWVMYLGARLGAASSSFSRLREPAAS